VYSINVLVDAASYNISTLFETHNASSIIAQNCNLSDTTILSRFEDAPDAFYKHLWNIGIHNRSALQCNEIISEITMRPYSISVEHEPMVGHFGAIAIIAIAGLAIVFVYLMARLYMLDKPTRGQRIGLDTTQERNPTETGQVKKTSLQLQIEDMSEVKSAPSSVDSNKYATSPSHGDYHRKLYSL
jgi:hypothetical protein